MRVEPLRFLGLIALIATTTLAACGDGSLPGAPGAEVELNPSLARSDTVAAAYGALEPRLMALDAFLGRRAAVTLRMVRSTVEGVEIVEDLAVQQGTAILSIDERADGGGVRTYTMSGMQLARLVPSVWQGNVEIRKERLEPVDPADAHGQAGHYFLVEPRCLTSQCAEVF